MEFQGEVLQISVLLLWWSLEYRLIPRSSQSTASVSEPCHWAGGRTKRHFPDFRAVGRVGGKRISSAYGQCRRKEWGIWSRWQTKDFFFLNARISVDLYRSIVKWRVENAEYEISGLIDVQSEKIPSEVTAIWFWIGKLEAPDRLQSTFLLWSAENYHCSQCEAFSSLVCSAELEESCVLKSKKDV